ncbi:hypothetical protein ACFE04_018260 [Oxalis oulophora]
MEKELCRRSKSSSLCVVVVWLAVTVQLLLLISSSVVAIAITPPIRKLLEEASSPAPSPSVHPVQLLEDHDEVTIDNGIFRITFQNPEGKVTGIEYNDISNLLEYRNDENNRGYWDVVWYEPGEKDNFDRVPGTNFTIIDNTDDIVEISFSKKWTASDRGRSVPLNVDLRYVVRSGVSGFYAYAIMERENGWPDVDMDQFRIVFKLAQNKFQYMAITDDRQRVMPSAHDRDTGKKLAYIEAVLLTNPSNPELKGEVDDKYQYSIENKDNRVHGWISTNPPVGFWMITPSNEFRMAGPNKQDLTSHAGPITLNMFTSTHYGGKEINTKYRNGEPWKKVFGPFFVYLNSLSDEDPHVTLWEDAKEQMFVEVGSWPYHFPKSEDYLKKEQRGTVSGQLLIDDKYLGDRKFYGRSANVGLAPPGEKGSWQTDSKSYQFWTEADNEGYFVINNVRPGNYSLYGWVPGIMGDYMYEHNITITEGCQIRLRVLVFTPPRNGPTIWEIGYPDRTAGEYFIPDPYPTLMNDLYRNHLDKFRQYGLWEKYSDIYRNNDLVYTVGLSDYSQDWFFAHVTRKIGNEFKATTWQIIFHLDNVITKGNYTLQMALASANNAEVQVRFNDEKSFTGDKSDFDYRHVTTTRLIGEDNAIARHGIHGLYRLFSFEIGSWRLRQGNNTIYLTQTREMDPFKGVMYDYVRLEGPPKP